MKYKDGRQNSQPDKVSRIVSITILLVVLCGVSFYLGGAFCSEKNRFEGKDIKDVKKAVPGPKELIVTPLQIKEVAFPECSLDYQDYTPCTDPKVRVIFHVIVFIFQVMWYQNNEILISVYWF